MEMLLSWGEVFTVVLTGLVIVFAALIILIAVVWAYGKVFTAINKNKQDKNDKKPDEKAAVTQTAGSAQAVTTGSAQAAASGIPQGVIAAITAAVAAFTDGKGVVTGIAVKKPRKSGKRRSTEWGYAGTVSSMKNLSRTGW
ncbi:MAG: OadG family protein [Ruminococcus sp.]|jgi:Na+-transporting methylmalonyl-CoA/oxaloacetate decarboxylase gamma subunit|nr:OadG family protein [Ruminococcus sp.]